MPTFVPQGRKPTDKSVGVAFCLTFFFGPLGVFYVSVLGAILLLVSAVIFAIFTLGIAIPFFWIGSIIYGCIKASAEHSRFQLMLSQPPYQPQPMQPPAASADQQQFAQRQTPPWMGP